MYQYLGSTDILLYDIFNPLGFIALLIFNIIQASKNKTVYKSSSIIPPASTKKAGFRKPSENTQIILKAIFLSVLQLAFAKNVNVAFGALLGTGDNFFGILFLSPVLLTLGCILFGIDFRKTIDLLTPGYPLALISIKTACFCHGCCNGIEWAHGLYNHNNQAYEFPSQLVEIILALIIFILFMCLRKKFKEGTVYPIFLISYSATRFFPEFLRSEPDVIWIFKTYHLLCIVGIIVGIIELFVAVKHGDKLAAAVDGFSQKLRTFVFKRITIKEKNIVHHQYKK